MPGHSSSFAVSLGCLLAAGAAFAELPERPAIEHDLVLVDETITGSKTSWRFNGPHLPAVRTTRDGRIGLTVKPQGGAFRFSVVVPETLGVPFDMSSAGSHVVVDSDEGEVDEDGLANELCPVVKATITGVDANADPDAGVNVCEGAEVSDLEVRHMTLCDTPGVPHPQGVSGVRACGDGEDCHDVFMVATVQLRVDGVKRVVLVSTPVTVRTERPRENTAVVAEVTPYADASTVSEPFPVPSMLEPMITDDGHLLVLRVGGRVLPDTVIADEELNVVYAVAQAHEQPCDAAAFSALRPITNAPYDDDMFIDDVARYGIADAEFRDAQGNTIPAGRDLKGSYPWIDRQGHNLFFTTLRSRLVYDNTGQTESRYPLRYPSDPDAPTIEDAKEADNGSTTRGVAVLGRWTRGKMVLLDNLVNNTDFGFGIGDAQDYSMKLYAADGDDDGYVPVGFGRDNQSKEKNGLVGFAGNSTFIDSTQNALNAHAHMKPVTPRDVVWRILTGKNSDEVAFDDYLDVDAVIVSEMAASLSWRADWDALEYHDGFQQYADRDQGGGFRKSPRVQNAATTDDAPKYGRLEGGARIEPIAAGGIVGRGVWLDGVDDSLSYDIGTPLDEWYLSVFVDARFSDDGVARRLVTLPDGSSLWLTGRAQVELRGDDGLVRGTPANLDADWTGQDRGWTHIAVARRQLWNGARLQVYVNGAIDRFWRVDDAGRMAVGTLTFGAVGGDEAVRGWFDEVKLLARVPLAEVACNHARGTLAELDADASQAWFDRADDSHRAFHNRVADALDDVSSPYYGTVADHTARRFVCFRDYTRGVVGVRDLESGMTSLRDALLMPEGPLVYDQPRPDSADNPFCHTCHTADAEPVSLSLLALAYQPDLAMIDDPRRQPMQAPAVMFGHRPANWLDLPDIELADPDPFGWSLDRWLHPAPSAE